jgi:phosphodiesterase/alkaline phosphatase D-like protein
VTAGTPTRLARRTGLAATAVLAVLVALTGLPAGSEPPLFADGTRIRVHLMILAGAAAGFVLARWMPLVGGVVAIIAGLAFGGLAVFAYHPVAAALAGVALAVPGLVIAAGGGHRVRSVVVVASTGVVAAGLAVAAAAGYQIMYGATHPSSTVPGPPRGDVRWIWAGASTPTEATVTAKLAHPGADAVLRVSPSARVDVTRRADVVVVRISGMHPGTRYRYSLVVGGRADGSGEGSFRTPPAGPASFTVAFSSCARTGSDGAVFDVIRAEHPVLFLHLGDMYYANITSDDPDRYRRAFDRVLTSPAQANLVRSTATAYVWDDHDFGPNDADRTAPGRHAAHRVYREYVPHYPFGLEGAEAPLAQAFTIGRVRFIVTDTRSARTPSSAPDDARKTMLGTEQRAWLESELDAANGHYPVIVWVNPDPWIGAARAGADGWAGYATERTAIADFIVRRRIRGLFMLSGDTHAVAIDDGTNSGYATGGGGGFPVMHAGALDRHPQGKGGPYSHGQFPGGGRYGLLEIEDIGGRVVSVALRGVDWRRRELTSLRLRLPVRPGG